MERKIVSIVNHKGGVGKTTTAASVGGLLALRGFRVLLVDLDAQANLTFSLKPELQFGRTVYEAFRERRDLPIEAVRENLFLSPSAMFFAGVELMVAKEISREYILQDLLAPVCGDFDIVLLDCPPSLGLVTLNALAASTETLVPMIAEALPFQGLTAIEDFLSMVRQRINPSLPPSGIILCKWEGRKLNRMVEDALRGRFGERVYNTKVRSNIAVAEAPLSRSHISEYSVKSRGAGDYSALTEEIISRLSLEKNALRQPSKMVTE